jgi:hypothetical protein
MENQLTQFIKELEEVCDNKMYCKVFKKLNKVKYMSHSDILSILTDRYHINKLMAKDLLVAYILTDYDYQEELNKGKTRYKINSSKYYCIDRVAKECLSHIQKQKTELQKIKEIQDEYFTYTHECIRELQE